jgi:hypothetical protein
MDIDDAWSRRDGVLRCGLVPLGDAFDQVVVAAVDRFREAIRELVVELWRASTKLRSRPKSQSRFGLDRFSRHYQRF